MTLMGTGVLAVFGYGILHFEASGLKSEIARLDSDLKTMKPVIADIEESEKQQALLAPRLKSLEAAQIQTDRWAHLLQHLRTQTPADTWIDLRMRATALQKDKPIETSLFKAPPRLRSRSGGEFILRFENEPDLQNA